MTRYSPSDLTRFLECEHLARLARDRTLATKASASAQLLRTKGLEHERGWLRRFAGEGRRVTEIGLSGDIPADHENGPSSSGEWERCAERTADAMCNGADVIYQAVFLCGDWRGIADFLVRVDTPSELGSWSYEAWDTKLARHTRPQYVLQLCFYSEQLARIQGRMPEWMVVVPGTNEPERLRYRDFDAYYRVVRRRFLDWSASGAATYPYPVEHCKVCDQQPGCDARWRADDHLCRVAGIRRQQVLRLNESGIRTVADFAAREPLSGVAISQAALERLRHQASLQDEYRRTGWHRYELLRLDERSGFRLLPRPSLGDIFFDIEGDPYFEPGRGLEYLFGVLTTGPAGAGGAAFEPILALTREDEKLAFERVIDFIHARLRAYPDLHVYHYAPYEVTAFKRLMSEHRTREAELDDLLRREVFVDLYQVVRQSLRASHESYSLKKMRTFFMEEAGRTGVADGGDSILQFERWLDTHEPAILDAIVRYNEEDCVSTLRLRDWLLERRAEGEGRDRITLPWKADVERGEDSGERAQDDEQTSRRAQQLLQPPVDSPSADGGSLCPDRATRALLADLLGYHRREAKPAWWAYFERRKKSIEQLLDDTDAIAGLTLAKDEAERAVARSVVYALDFPPQEYKLSAGSTVDDPFREGSAGMIERIDSERGRLWLKRSVARRDEPLPAAIVVQKPRDTKEQRGALGRIADHVLATTAQETPPRTPRYRAALDILSRHKPRMTVSGPVHTLDLEEQKARVAALDAGCLFIQGPPGSGKTYTGARLIVALLAEGKRVGVAAHSHNAINNLLAEVEKVAAPVPPERRSREGGGQGLVFKGLKKHNNDEDAFHGDLITGTTSNTDCLSRDVALVAGTSWLFSRAEMDSTLDYLFIDEAGQVALADALAMATAATNVVVLGDPQQLPQVRQGIHAAIHLEGQDSATLTRPALTSGCSVLEHLLGGARTVPEDRGIFLARSWRMHPEVCRFVSSLSYEDRLESADGRHSIRVSSSRLCGAGLRHVPVDHEGNSQQSVEEARAISAEVAALLNGGTFTDHQGQTRPLTPSDILVVAPFNMQVRCLRDVLPEGVHAGTVDRFQGREAPVVFFSMASSSGEDVPRGLEFLFSRHRFNVAISRAMALAVVVCNPRLLEARCRSVEQMRLASAICRFAEQALRGL